MKPTILYELVRKDKRSLCVGFFLLVLAAGFCLYSSFIDQGGMLERGNTPNQFKVHIPSGLAWKNNYKAAILGNSDFYPVLRVAVPPKSRMTSLLSPFGEGFERDLLERFGGDYGFSMQYTEVTSLDEAARLIAKGEADLAAGFTAPSTSFEGVDSGKMTVGPAYRKVTPMLLTVGRTKKNEKAELMVADPCLAESVPGDTAALDEEPLSEDVSELVAFLEQGQKGYALVDNAYINMLRPLFNNVRTSTRSLSGNVYHHWIWRNDKSLAALSLNAFWQDKTTKNYLDDLQEKYQAFIPKNQNRQQTSNLIKGLERELVQYHAAINAAAREYNLDPLFLTAIMYQESHFQNTNGNSGQGLMQLTQSTAASLGVNPNDPAANIRGGAKYLRSIYDSLPEDMGYWDKWFLALAAYNQGPGTLSAAMQVAKKNDEELSWRLVKEAYLYLEGNPGAASRSQVRGKHVVNYVQKIRYYYYVLNGIVVLDRPEAEHLTPLLASRATVTGSGS